MNYGKEPLEKKKEQISSKKPMKKKRVGVRLFHALLICFLILVILVVGGAGYFAKVIIDDAPVITPDNVRPKGFSSFVYAETDGSLLEKFSDADANRVYQTIDTLPDYVGKSFVAVEDERFYQHNGIDPQGIVRAGVRTVLSGFKRREGASTLTQQLIKNNVFPDFLNEATFMDSLKRKLQEQVLALSIEKQMSKDEILEAYMNTVNLGQGCYGIQAAAQRYFGKNAADLTLSEATVIAGITQNPSAYDPTIYPENNAEKREIVLTKLLEQGYITQAAFDEAMADNVYERIKINPPYEETRPYSYFIDALLYQLYDDLQERKGYTYQQARDLIFSGGLQIYATQNPWVQWICDEEINNPDIYSSFGAQSGVELAISVYWADGREEQHFSKEMFHQYITKAWGIDYPVFYSQEEAYAAVNEYKSTLGITEEDTVVERIDITPQPQASVVVMDQKTGKVLAISGGRGEKTASLSFNRATANPRQPGSCFKVLSTFAPAIDSCGYTLAHSVDDDEPFTYANGDTAKNWDGRYIGPTTIRRAIAHSINVVTLKTLTAIGPRTGYDYLINFGFTTLVEMDENGNTDIQQATALGGITNGVTNLELTAAYAAIANGGVYNKPVYYTKVLDHDGNILLDNSTPESHRVLKETTAALLTDAMEDVVNGPYGTGGEAALPNMAEAGKTGTTDDSKDLWFVGYTPYYTAGVWGGFDAYKPMANIYSQSWHKTLWKNIMMRLHADQPYTDFTMPAGIQKQTVCSRSGNLASSHCAATITEYFAAGSIPSKRCSLCEEEWQKAEEERIKQEEEERRRQEEEERNNQNGEGNGENPGGNEGGNEGNNGGNTGGEGGNTGGEGGNNGGNTGGEGGNNGGNTGGEGGNNGGNTGGEGGNNGGGEGGT